VSATNHKTIELRNGRAHGRRLVVPINTTEVSVPIEGAKGFVLRSYEFDDKNEFKVEDLKPILDQLKEPNWKLFLRAKEDDELTEIWTHVTNGMADGMLLIAAERTELTVIYGLGVADINQLKALGKLDGLK